ncbi:hypothetical protein [Streptomyces sp. NPDC018833]|uniref:hypothetical protein n=1 Tax=Streptomyces sp. NPDC018833 TaxID=3365053 RepID=UPI0037B3EA9B
MSAGRGRCSPLRRTSTGTPASAIATAAVPGSGIVYALWPLIAVALAVAVVRRRDV